MLSQPLGVSCCVVQNYIGEEKWDVLSCFESLVEEKERMVLSFRSHQELRIDASLVSDGVVASAFAVELEGS